MTKEKRREIIASDIGNEISSVPPSRLLTLLNQSLKWQQSHGLLPIGSKIDLFKGTVSTSSNQESFPFPKGHSPECLAFSSDGHTLVTGSADGFIEVWNYNTGKLRKDLPYQASIWRISDGTCTKKFLSVHPGGVLGVYFSSDKSYLATCGFDHTIKILGMRSNKVLRELRGHSSYVNSIVFNPGMTRVISGSSDGSVRVWEQSTGRCLYTLYPINPDTSLTIPPIDLLCPSHNKKEFEVLVVNGTQYIYLYSEDTEKLTPVLDSDDSKVKLVSAAFSFDCEFVYCIGSDHNIYCFNYKTKLLVSKLPISEPSHTFVSSSTSSNVVATFGRSRYVIMWSS
ncbi:Suppressor of mec-8 and unc-52 protein-like protein [Smittium mucronatum]|uniref:Suppressor of mec-8 and unc-52 protein-like protein n=1 Tax=Smittium mucronatum TaxID=133383 RepID=A0A1R0GWD5_9FUNG|nr:Suppressor of mec-8 and unc-52 protein-like protein [Smittium mucronatum]OLY81211.1 Suppressor of mec-8 and unc-52 protein-like protein [Smittium mucronatum]